MDIAQIFDIIAGLISTGIVLVGVWVRQLNGTIGSLSSKLDRVMEDQTREHASVMESVRDLSGNVTAEVRGIVNQHSEHDKQNTRIETKVDGIVRRQIEIHQDLNK